MSEQTSNPARENAGIAGGMAKAFIHSPLSPLLYLAMLVLGVIGLMSTPRQEDPQISVPMVDIFFEYPGASAEQAAHLAVDPLQRMMSEIPGVKHVYGAARRDGGLVTVQFEVGQPLEHSTSKVRSKLENNMDKIPPGVQGPLVKRKSIDDVPVVTLTLWSRDVDDNRLRLLALDVLQRLKEIPETGEGFVVGGRREQIRVEVSPERLAGFGIGLDQVAQTIRTANDEQNTGSVETGGRHFTVYSGAFLRTAEDVRRLVVGTYRGSDVYVRDIARVLQGPEEPKEMVAYYSGEAYAAVGAEGESSQPVNAAQAVTIALAKKEGANGVSVAQAIIDRVEALKGRMIPGNVQVAVTRNYGVTAKDKVNGLLKKLAIATGAVTLLVLLALGWKPAVVVTLIIPVVLLMTVFAAWILGMTIDRVSLFALIFAIGILVDDAIVVVENIYRRWLMAENMKTDVAVDAVREVGNPTIIATFTVIAALLPMAAVSGMMGPYMAPIPTLGSVAMLVSLVAAFAFTPYLAMRIRPSMKALEGMEESEHRMRRWVQGLFDRVLVPLIRERRNGWIFLAVLISGFFLSVALFPANWVEVKMLPYDNKPEFSLVVDMPEGTALPETANMAAAIAQRLRTVEEVTAVQTYVGTAQPFDFNGMVRHYYLRNEPWHAEVHVQLLDKGDRDRSSHELALLARDLVKDLAARPGVSITVVEMPPGPPVLQSVVAEVYGPDDYSRRQAASQMTRVFEQTAAEDGSLADVDNYMQAGHQVWRFEVNTEKAVRRGISVDGVNRNLAMAMGGFRLGDVKMGTVLEPTYIVIEVPLAARAAIHRLLELPIPSQSGGSVPLGELGRFVQAPSDPIIYFKDLRRVEYVVADVAGDLAAPLYGMLDVEARLQAQPLADGTVLTGTMTGPPADRDRAAFEWAGEWTVTYETFRDMGIAFAAALILIYILVVWEFGNFIVPLVIMAPIPLTLMGIVPGHWFMDALIGAEFTATSMIGFIALAGIIVRNSILLVDFVIHDVAQGADVADAVVRACVARTRPIVITALALVMGSMVILTDPIFQGMAISLLFGVLVSTVLTLVVVPLGCVSARGAIENLALAHARQTVDLDDDEEDGPASASKAATPESGSGRWAKLAQGVMLGVYTVRAVFMVAWIFLEDWIRTLRKRKAAQETPPEDKPASRPAEDMAAPSSAESGLSPEPVQVRTGGEHASPEDDAGINASADSDKKPVTDPAPAEPDERPAEDSAPHAAAAPVEDPSPDPTTAQTADAQQEPAAESETPRPARRKRRGIRLKDS